MAGLTVSLKRMPSDWMSIYIQAKRWLEGNVGRPELQKFVGALHERQGAQKGIFITTSDFTPSAIEYVERIASKIILIDGGQLVATI